MGIVNYNQTSSNSKGLSIQTGAATNFLQKSFSDVKNSFVPIRTLTNLDAKLRLSISVKNILELYGVVEISDKSLQETVKFIIQNYSTLDVRELRIAFDYAAVGKIDAEPIFYKSVSSLQVWGSVLDAYCKNRVELDRLHKQQELTNRIIEQEKYINSDVFKQNTYNSICAKVKDFFAKKYDPTQLPFFWCKYFTEEVKIIKPFEADYLQLLEQENIELEKISRSSIEQVREWSRLSENVKTEKIKSAALIAAEKKYLFTKLKEKYDSGFFV